MIVALLFGTFLASLDTTLLGAAMPRISAELNDVSLYPWAFSIFLLASTAMLPTYGKLADILGRRGPYLIGLALLVIGSALCGAARSMPMLVAARAVQGAGSGALFLVAQIIFGDLFPETAQRSRMQSLFSAVWSISAVLGPILGGLFVDYWSWRWAFYINVPLGLGIGVLLFFSYADPPVKKASAKRFQLDLGVLLVAALSALYVGLGKDGVRPLWLGVGLLLGLVFAVRNRRAAEPLLPPGLYQDRVLAMAYAAIAINGAIQLAFISFAPLYLQGVLGLSPTRAGWMTSFPVTVAWTASAFFCGRLMVRRSREFVLRLGAVAVLAATLATLAAMRGTAGLAVFVLFEAGQLALGLGLGFVVTTLMITVQQRVTWEQRGVATSGLQLHRQLGATLGVASLGMIFALRTTGQPASASLRVLFDPEALRGLTGVRAAEVSALLAGILQSLTILGVAAAVLSVVLCSLVPGSAPAAEKPLPKP